MSDIIAHAFPEDTRLYSHDISSLTAVSDRISEKISTIIGQVADRNVAAETGDCQMLSFAEWTDATPDFSSLSLFRISPLKGAVMLRIDDALITSLIDIYFGGSGDRPGDRKQPYFREVEVRMINRISISLIENILHCFRDINPTEVLTLAHETNPHHVKICAAEDKIACQKFNVTFGTEQSWSVELIYTAEMVESLSADDRGGSIATENSDNPFWEALWLEQLQRVHIPIRAVVARPTMTLPQLFQMVPGDFIPITPQSAVPLLVANRKFATGTLGEQDGYAAYKIEKIERGEAA